MSTSFYLKKSPIITEDETQFLSIDFKCPLCFLFFCFFFVIRKTNKSNSNFIKWTHHFSPACAHKGKIKNALRKKITEVFISSLKFLILSTGLQWRRSSAKIAVRWRCRLPMKNLAQHHYSQFCDSFHCCIDQEARRGL